MTSLHARRRQRRAVLDSDTDEVAEAEPTAEDPGAASVSEAFTAVRDNMHAVL